MDTVRVTRSYLQLSSPAALRRTPLDPDFRIEHAHPCPISFFRYLYEEVGRDYRWTDRLRWSDEQCAAHLADPNIFIWVLYGSGVPAGYCELRKHDDDSAEIAYLGLIHDFIGQGLGKQLLSEAAERAWSLGVSRVWLHTCTLDYPTALPNYLARGFEKYREEVFEIPR